MDEDIQVRAKKKIDELKSSKFKQQELPAWRPTPSFNSTLITFLLFGLIFLIIGIVLIEISQRYDDTCGTADGTDCTVKISVDDEMKQPVYFYYQLDNFYQNHRRYVKSRSFTQLRGEELAVSALGDCEPIVKNKDLELATNKNVAYDGSTALDPEAPANPCGLIAKSFFNDEYSMLKDSASKAFLIDESDIAWESDVQEKFKLPTNSDKIQWHKSTDEHFIVWMRTAGLPNFRKLWGRVKEDIPKGTYTITVKNNYDVSKFDGKKFIVLSTTNAFGGKNDFLGICYLIVGSLCFVFALIIFIAHKKKAGGN